MRISRVVSVVTLLSLAACSFDLAVPMGHQVALIADDGSQLTQPTGAQGEFTFGDVKPGTQFGGSRIYVGSGESLNVYELE